LSRHSPLSPETVATIRNSPESNAAMAREFGISKQTVSQIRLGNIHKVKTEREDGKLRASRAEGRTPTHQQAAAVRAILMRPPTESHLAAATALGVSRETVRKVRFGLQWPEVLPHLERLEITKQGAYCYRCVHWSSAGDGYCSLGVPEAALEGHLYARGCGAFYSAHKK
jgi:DNA-binding XRE family transcriptional regulator